MEKVTIKMGLGEYEMTTDQIAKDFDRHDMLMDAVSAYFTGNGDYFTKENAEAYLKQRISELNP